MGEITFLRGPRWWACAHSVTTDEDAEGYAVCVACGTLVLETLTAAQLAEAFEDVRRSG